MRREDECVGKRVVAMEVSEKRRRGRPKRRWLDNIRNHLSERELPGGSARRISMEASHKKHRPHIHVGKDAEGEEEECDFTSVTCPRHNNFIFFILCISGCSGLPCH